MDRSQSRILSRYASKVGPKLGKFFYNYFTNPSTYTSMGIGAGEGAASATMGAGETGAGATTGAGMAEGGTVGVGGALSIAAPLIMAYLKYQAGSGANTPLRHRNELAGAGKYLADLFAGKAPDAARYGLFNPNPNDGRYLTPYETMTQYVMPNLTWRGGKEINAVISPPQFYGYLRSQGITDDWLNQRFGASLSDWAKPDLDLNQWGSGMKDLDMENLRQQALSGDKEAKADWYALNPYQTPQEAEDPEFWNKHFDDGLMAQRQANANWNWNELTPELQEWEREREMRRLSGLG